MDKNICLNLVKKDQLCAIALKGEHRHARRARVIFFCDLKAPGGSTRWTHKGNSFMCTGVPDSSQCHYKVKCSCTNFDDCCPEMFHNNSSDQLFSFFFTFLADIPTNT